MDRVKALHGEQCHELQKQIEEVRGNRRIMFIGSRNVQSNSNCSIILTEPKWPQETTSFPGSARMTVRRETLETRKSQEIALIFGIYSSQLQRTFEEKNSIISQLETSLAASRQELSLKKSLTDQMERALQEQKQEIQLRDSQSAQHGQKLEKLEEQADKATQQVRKMEVSLAECHKEIEMYVEQLKEARAAHEQELEEKRLEVRFMLPSFSNIIYSKKL